MDCKKTSKRAQPTQSKPSRRPHNVAAPVDRSLKELLNRILIEPRDVIIDGEKRTITRGERGLRLTVGRATDGKVRDIAQILKMMTDNPELAANVRTETIYFINGPLANV